MARGGPKIPQNGPGGGPKHPKLSPSPPKTSPGNLRGTLKPPKRTLESFRGALSWPKAPPEWLQIVPKWPRPPKWPRDPQNNPVSHRPPPIHLVGVEQRLQGRQDVGEQRPQQLLKEGKNSKKKPFWGGPETIGGAPKPPQGTPKPSRARNGSSRVSKWPVLALKTATETRVQGPLRGATRPTFWGVKLLFWGAPKPNVRVIKASFWTSAKTVALGEPGNHRFGTPKPFVPGFPKTAALRGPILGLETAISRSPKSTILG